jgi:hypothetical protein
MCPSRGTLAVCCPWGWSIAQLDRRLGPARAWLASRNSRRLPRSTVVSPEPTEHATDQPLLSPAPVSGSREPSGPFHQPDRMPAASGRAHGPPISAGVRPVCDRRSRLGAPGAGRRLGALVLATIGRAAGGAVARLLRRPRPPRRGGWARPGARWQAFGQPGDGRDMNEQLYPPAAASSSGPPIRASTCSRVRRRHTGMPIAIRQRPPRSSCRGR